MVPQKAQFNQPRRISREGVWPLRDAEGKTWADRKKEAESKQ